MEVGSTHSSTNAFGGGVGLGAFPRLGLRNHLTNLQCHALGNGFSPTPRCFDNGNDSSRAFHDHNRGCGASTGGSSLLSTY